MKEVHARQKEQARSQGQLLGSPQPFGSHLDSWVSACGVEPGAPRDTRDHVSHWAYGVWQQAVRPEEPQGHAELSDDMVPGRGVEGRMGIRVGRRWLPQPQQGAGRVLSVLSLTLGRRERGGRGRKAGAFPHPSALQHWLSGPCDQISPSEGEGQAEGEAAGPGSHPRSHPAFRWSSLLSFPGFESSGPHMPLSFRLPGGSSLSTRGGWREGF